MIMKYIGKLWCIALMAVIGFSMAACQNPTDSGPKSTAVTGVNLNKSTLSLTVGGTETLTAMFAPPDATNMAVNWTSTNIAVATVNNGTVTAVAAGTATIIVTTVDGGKTDICAVTVTAPDPVIPDPITVTGVSLNKSTLSLTVGGTENLAATVTPPDADNKSITWASSDTAIATVNTSGLVTAIVTGSAKITVTTQDGNKTAECTVTVTAAGTVIPDPIAVTGVTLNETTLALIVGGTETLTAAVVPSNADNKNITWASSDTTVATVNTSGLVTAVAEGTVTITVTTADGGKTAECAVTVTIPVTGVTLNKTMLALSTGGTETLIAIIAPSNASNKNVTWASSDTAVATVNTDGLVTAIAGGTTKITVTTQDGGKAAECAVTVTVAVTGVTLNKSSLTLDVGDEETLTVTVAPSNAANKRVTWSSSKPDIVTVTGGRITAVDSGTAIITVTTQDGGKTATCTVRVRAPAPGEPGGSGPTLKTLNGAIAINPSTNVTTGTVLTATYGGNETITLTYQWRRGTTNVGTGTTYMPTTAGNYTVTVSATGYNPKTSAAVTVTALLLTITIDPSYINVLKGGTQTFTATVNGTNNPPQTVTWSVTGGGTGTSISNSGVLTVGANENASNLIIRATSTYDTTKYAETTVWVTSTADVGNHMQFAFDTNNNLHLNYDYQIYPGDTTIWARIYSSVIYNQEITYTWYINGVLQAGYTYREVNLPVGGLSPGIYYGLVIVTIDGVAFSRDFAFRIME